MLHSESPNRRILLRLALMGLTLIAHGAVGTHDFVNFDDPQTISDNPRLRPPSLGNIAYYWKNRGLELYIPCTYTVWSLTAAASGVYHGSNYVLRPVGFHLVNLVCHLLSVLIVFEILQLLLKSPESAAVGAALFAVHPLQVEAVAWATGLKDVLSGLAALTAIWLYLRAISQSPMTVRSNPISLRSYLLATIAFAIAVLAKPAAVAAIGIAAILDLYVSQAKLPRLILRLSPWMAIGLAVAMIAHHVQPAGDVADNPPILRPLLALDAVSFYVWKLCWLISLCPDYGRRPTVVINQGYIAWTWAIPLALGWLAWSVRRTHRIVPAATAVFLAGLLPTLGFVPFIYQRNSTVADRYVYLAMLGPAIMLGWCYYRYARARIPAVILIGAMVICSIRQEAFWTDSLHLFAHSTQVSPSAPFNHLNYGAALASAGRFEEAAAQFRQTITLAPQNAVARDNLSQVQRLLAGRSGGQP